MKIKKTVGILIAIIALLLVFIYLGFSNIFSNNVNKLRADISYPTSNGLKIECDSSTVNVGSEVNCALTGYLSVTPTKPDKTGNGISGLTGTFYSEGGIELKDFTLTDGWSNFGRVPELSLQYDGVTPDKQFVVGTFKIKGTSEGAATLKLRGNPEDDYKLILSDDDDQNVIVQDTIYNMTITNGGGDDPTPQSSNADLSELVVVRPPEPDNLITNFNPNTLAYTVPVPAEHDGDSYFVRVNGTPADSGASISISDGGAIDITNVQSRVVSIEVTAPNGNKKVYTVTINKMAPSDKSTDAKLKSLSVTGATLAPTFDKDVYSYSAIVSNSVSSVTINAQPNDTKATITGDTGTKSLSVGDNTFNIVVTAEDTNYKKTYTIIISREEAIDPSKSSDNTLKSLSIDNVTLTPAFDKNTTSYTATVDSLVSKINIKATANDSKAEIDGTGEKTLENIENSFNIVVTAENNSKKIYTIVVTKKVIPVCTDLKLISSVYKVDNDKLLVSNVNRDHSLDTIKSNLSASCGTINVTENKVILSSDTQIKEYTIERVWQPQTGQNVIKYTLVIVVIVGIIGALLFIKKKMDK